MRPVITSVLKNGFRVYSQYDSTNSTNLCGVCVKIGSSSDPPQFDGLAHILEHCIFRKSKTYSLNDVLLAIHRIGGADSLNVWTDKMSTFFGIPNLLRSSSLKEYFSLIADLVRNFKVDLTGLKTEKGAIHPEIFSKGVDDPEVEIVDILYENVYTNNPIRNRISGNPFTLKPIPPSRVTNFYNKYYVAPNMAAIILGPKHHDAVEMVKEFFGDMSFCKVPDRFKNYEVSSERLPFFDAPKTVVQERLGIHLAHLVIGFPVEITDKDAPAFELLERILEFRLWMRLREENQDFNSGIYRVYVDFDRSELHSILTVQTAINVLRIDSVTETIISEFQKLRSESIEDLLFKASKIALLSNWQANFGEGEALCDLIIDAFANSDEELRDLHHYPKTLRRISPKKLTALANQYINPQSYVMAIIKPAQ